MQKQSQKKPSSQFLKTDGGKTKSNAIEVPSISLPKGGGAIKGIDEKFSVNAVNGTSSFSLPLPFSPARGASPSLSLSYSSGAGNSIFGLGWNLSLGSIKRKTDKGLPQYLDSIDSDTFLFSEAEDLVPEFKKNPNGSFQLDTEGEYIINERDSKDEQFTIRNYKPRIEGLFARIERWTEKTSGRIKWRVITKENITTLFGWTDNSIISNPDDGLKIYEWLPEFVFDDKGNCSHYIYKKEDKVGFNESLLHNRNRLRDGVITYTNLYIDKILYGNKTPFKQFGDEPLPETDYIFQTVFDYGTPLVNDSFEKINPWDFRPDAFSDYKAGFEIRTTRLCKRVLLFHVFEELALKADKSDKKTLIKSINFEYDTSIEQDFTFLKAITSYGYIKKPDGTYSHKKLPPMEFKYQKHDWNRDVKTISAEDLVHAPVGLDEQQYQFTDLFNEGLSGILTEQANGWYYKHNLGDGKFEQAKLVSPKPSFAGLGGQLQLADLDADGGKQLVSFGTEPRGYFELDDDNEWQGLRSFKALPNINFGDANTRMLDLNGDGKPDVVISDDNVFTWYASEGRDGFAAAQKTTKPFDEEAGPHIVFADQKQTIFLADMSGDGPTDIVRIRNGEVCYWPNLGYGKFGAKVALDNSPIFDYPDAFNPAYLRLADIDGSGTTDIIYLGKNKFTCWKNLSGNRFSTTPFEIDPFPEIHSQSKITVTDLLGNGVACIVWSSQLSKDKNSPLKYIDLMNSKKPHIMVSYKNNLGKEVSLEYTPSTKFYLEDKKAGKPWVTKLHFPVHCVSKTTTEDKISGHKFVSEYKYHHGYYDHPEREFRGFGMVEQWDTEDYKYDAQNAKSNQNPAFDLPPVYTKTWFHTGAYLDGAKISRQFEDEYFKEPGKNGKELEELLLPDTILPPDLSIKEEIEACRALKGSILRQEVYADDKGEKSTFPYSVSERSYTIKNIQPTGDNKHAIFFVHPCETIDYNYERNPVDPRIAHQLTLQVDDFGNVKKSVAIGYGRRKRIITVDNNGKRVEADNPELKALSPDDQKKQTQILITYTEADYTLAIDDEEDDWRTPLPAEIRTYELTGISPEKGERFAFNDLYGEDYSNIPELPYEVITPGNAKQKRLIERVRSLYCKDDLSGALPLGISGKLALPYETYKQAFTPGLLTKIYGSKLNEHQIKTILKTDGKYLDLDNDGNWWIPSGQQQFDKNRFYLPAKFIDPFGHEYQIGYDDYSLLMITTIDPLGNTAKAENDYRVLQPRKLKDPNENLSELRFDALGMVTGTAIMGKTSESFGDSFTQFNPDPLQKDIEDFLSNPKGDKAIEMLDGATTRIIYDLHNYRNNGKPAFSATIARENHVCDLDGETPKIQVSFSYSDGFGREIQKKIQAEQGKVPKRVNGKIIIKSDGQPEMTDNPNPYRWVGSGWTIFNNKGKPVRQFEPFFSDTHGFDPDTKIGVSPILIYDQAERVIATLHPNHTYEKVVFDAWKQTTWDVNDNVLNDPSADTDIKGFVKDLDIKEYQPTWYKFRTDDALSSIYWPDNANPKNKDIRGWEKAAAQKAALHAETPQITYFDSLGRVFLTLEHNKYAKKENGNTIWEDKKYRTTVEMDIEGNQRSVTDAKGRVVMRYDYYMAGPEKKDEGASNLIHQHSMEAGERWILNNVVGKPIYLWNSRNFRVRTEYDELNRPLALFMQEEDTPEIMVERLVYGEYHTDKSLNLRTKLYKHFDQSGVTTSARFDFKGNPIVTKRQFANSYKGYVDWRCLQNIEEIDTINAKAATLLESEEFTSFTSYDALNRPTQLVTPYTTGTKPNIIQPGYNDANLLEKVDVWIRRSNAPDRLLNTDNANQHIVTNIDYNAKGQREKIEYGNKTVTTYEYEFETFRLQHILTTRSTGYPQICKNETSLSERQQLKCPKESAICNAVQNLWYNYDPTGNITSITDDAQQTVFFKNRCVEPSNQYEYDAIYRLIEATGREHVGQTNGSLNKPEQPTHDDSFRVNHPHPHDGNAMDSYTENYDYDEVGNILKMIHHASSGGWKRSYKYTETSLLESSKASNRLSATSMPDDNENGPYHGKYTYDAHGNMTTMPHLPLMDWDYKDQLIASSKQVVNSGTPETTWYVYDSSGQRVRKITESQAADGNAPKKTKERYYLGQFEIYREYNADVSRILERESLSVMDDKARIALIETKTHESGILNALRNLASDPNPLYRFQYSNHLGSACLELDEQSAFISYEEYYPYGNTSFQSVDSQREVPAKRYLYTGKERDEESGLDYYGARYYASWFGRWCSCDPLSFIDGINIYKYSKNQPIICHDPLGYASNSVVNIDSSLTQLSYKTYDFLGDVVDYSQEAIKLSSMLKPEVTVNNVFYEEDSYLLNVSIQNLYYSLIESQPDEILLNDEQAGTNRDVISHLLGNYLMKQMSLVSRIVSSKSELSIFSEKESMIELGKETISFLLNEIAEKIPKIKGFSPIEGMPEDPISLQEKGEKFEFLIGKMSGEQKVEKAEMSEERKNQIKQLLEIENSSLIYQIGDSIQRMNEAKRDLTGLSSYFEEKHLMQLLERYILLTALSYSFSAATAPPSVVKN